jgi:hypothetical protein
VPKLLSELGTYFVYDPDVYTPESATSIGEQDQRLHGIQLAHNALQEIYGLKKITLVESGRRKDTNLNYVVFRKGRAPKIKVN